jgi:phosphoglucosamine mutase
LFGGEGYKLPDEVEDEIEHHVFNNGAELTLATGTAIGTVKRIDTALADYVDYLAKAIDADLTGLQVAFDCANGAASATAQLLFPRLGATCYFIGNTPDGGNINADCGSTHLDKLARYVVTHGLDCGVAFDGDADRCLAVDEKGQEIDGDKIIAILARGLKAQGKLKEDTAVVTVMSNLGFMEFMKANGMKTAITAVGDRYVLEEMRDKGYVIGGEQSGHVILLQHSTTGDGELTAGMLLRTMAQQGCAMSELNGLFERFPQVMVNIRATAAEKARFKEDEYIAGFIESQQQSLMGQGRVLVRVSGTEPLIRVMVEGRDHEAIAASADRIAVKINERIH